MALPFLLLIGMGLVEMGLGWMSVTDVTSAGRDAARAGTSAPAAAVADHSVLLTIASALSGSDLDGLQRVVIYNASTSASPVPTACTTSSLSNDGATGATSSAMGSSASSCNVYGPKLIKWIAANPNDLNYFGGSLDTPVTACKSPMLDRIWCPATRPRSQANNDQAYLGVYIEVNHKSITHSGFGDMTIKRTTVFRLEPSYGGK